MNKNTDEELFAEELAASLSRQISGEEIEEHVLDFSEDHSEKLIDLDLLDDLDIEEEKEDPDALLRELQAAVEKEFSTEAEDTEAKTEEPVAEEAEAEAEETVEEETEVEAEEAVEEETEAEAEEPVAEEAEAEAEEAVAEETEAKAEEPVAEEAEAEAEEAVAEEAEAKAEEPVAEEAVAEETEAKAEEPVAEEAEEAEAEETEEAVAEETEAKAEEPVAEETEAKAEESVAEAVEAVAQAVVAEEIAEEAVEAVAEVIAENEDNGEAFDEPDAGVADVSQGVTSVIDAPTEELPKISESQLSAKEQKKEEKKRLKQEAAEARAREKEEAKEQKRLEKEERKANKKKGKGKLIFGLLLLLIAACAVVYLGLSNRYKTVFFDGTKINGADCTGLTVEETETVITRQMDTYDLKLVFRDGKQELITGDSVGFEYVPDGSVQEIKDSQVPIKWASAFFQEYSYDATASSEYDEAKLTQTITGLEECNIVNMTPPQDAYLTFNETTHQFEIVPEQKGNKFDLTSLITTIQDAIINGVTEIDVESLDIYENPTITSDNAELIAKRDDLNGLISPVITYTLPNGTEKVLDKTTLVTWLEHDENGNYSFNEELWGNNIANYVEELAGEVNTSDSTAEFKTHSGGTVNLENFLQGWLVDDEEEGRKLAENLAARETVTREPIYSQRAFSDVNNGIGNTYVEVDLTAQHLWVVDNGQVINETPVVSGMMVYSRFTPEGIYPLYGKQQGRWLRGAQAADGSYEYESWVDYWMPFNGGIGLHDASWRVDFGGNIYVGGGSHGCVNLPHNKAAEIFDWIEGGTPIICYYTGGIQLADE